MKSDILTDYYRPFLERNNFLPIPCPEKFSPAGRCWEIAPQVGGGAFLRGQGHRGHRAGRGRVAAAEPEAGAPPFRQRIRQGFKTWSATLPTTTPSTFRSDALRASPA